MRDGESYVLGLKPFTCQEIINAEYTNFVIALNCKTWSITPLTDYANNAIYQELTTEGDYFNYFSNKCLHIDLRDSQVYTRQIERLI